MKIAIDASRIVNEKAGVGRYTANLVRALLRTDRKNQYLLVCNFFRPSPVKQTLMESFRAKNVEIKYLKMPGKLKEKVWQSRLPLARKILAEADIYLAPTFLDVVKNLPIPQIVVIHDLSTFKYPEHLGHKIASYFNRQIKEATKVAARVISISENTKRDLIEILHIDPEKIQVIYPGLAKLPKPAPSLPGALERNSYILTVGTLEPRKNLTGLFKAYALLPIEIQENFPLVVAGAKGWNTGEIFELIEQLKLKEKVKFLGLVEDKILSRLYQDAKLFVYPSLYEGFGLPVLEALSFGLPVITSNISSLPEVVGKAGVLIDPTEPKSIAKAMQRLLEHQNEAESLGKAGKNQVKKFSWDKAGLAVLKLLKSLVK